MQFTALVRSMDDIDMTTTLEARTYEQARIAIRHMEAWALAKPASELLLYDYVPAPRPTPPLALVA